ncbi:GNAT family protein [Gryllotalpicola sp.]|uniref:GNAT family N-acetyltransferase n=1 Tax=Gryllotalpicola sp. TaxID=1932787 RepID=UPI002621C285|nr:GNAT family protein [Gryllotalpicola sp.]
MARTVDRLTLRAFASTDYEELISWFPTDAELELFIGVSGAGPLTVEQLERRQHEPGVRAYSAVFDDSTLAGHVELVDAAPGQVRLARVAIAPRLRGRGLAGQLIDCALGEVRRSTTATMVGLLVVPGNTPALRSYARAGFADAGANPEYPQYIWMTRAI